MSGGTDIRSACLPMVRRVVENPGPWKVDRYANLSEEVGKLTLVDRGDDGNDPSSDRHDLHRLKATGRQGLEVSDGGTVLGGIQ